MRVERQNAWPSVDHDIHGWLNTLLVHDAAGLLLQDLPPAAVGVADGRAVHPLEGRSRQGAERPGPRTARGAQPAPRRPGDRGRPPPGSRRRPRPRARVRRRWCWRSAPRSAVDGRRAGGRRPRPAGARIIAGTPAFGVFGGPLVAAANGDRLYRIRARHLVFATGAVEQAAVFPNNDLPGVMLSSAVDLLVDRYRVLPGRRAVVLTSSEKGYETARALRGAGADVTVVDLRPDARPVDGLAVIARLHDRGRARGAAASREVVVGAAGRARGPKVRCDLVVLAGVPGALDEPARAGGRRARVRRGGAGVPARRSCPRTCHAAGAVAGARSLEGAIAQGRLAGLEAATALGLAAPDVDERIERLRAAGRRRTGPRRPAAGGAAPATASSSPACAWT